MSASYRVDADPHAVAAILREPDFAAASLARAGHRIRAAARPLDPGDRVWIGLRVGPFRVPVPTAIRTAGPDRFLFVGAGLVHHTVAIDPDGTGTRVEDAIRWPVPVQHGLIGDILAARAAELRARVIPVVVATALIRDGRVLAARRTRPPALAGRWELPGGRVEPGEAEEGAVVRESREELGADVVATGRIGPDLPIAAGLLRVHRAELAPGSPEPVALEHAELRWLTAAELDGVAWLDADRAVLPSLRPLLR